MMCLPFNETGSVHAVSCSKAVEQLARRDVSYCASEADTTRTRVVHTLHRLCTGLFFS